jgi:DNA-binding HxlR family transcriptional regulator
MKRKIRSHCPVGLALDIFGDRWSLLILRDLLVRGKTRYQEFLSSKEGIATNILANRLALLEEHKLISKSHDPANRKRILYAPTRKGLDVMPILSEMARWGLKHRPEAESSPVVRDVRRRRKAFETEAPTRLKDVGSRSMK